MLAGIMFVPLNLRGNTWLLSYEVRGLLGHRKKYPDLPKSLN